MLSPLLFLAVACQEYNLNGPPVYEGQYNPPELGVDTHVDKITQVTVPAVDVLFVVDNSGSMSEEQASLRDNFDGFMRYFTSSDMDYHVGVVSTDMDNRNESGKLIEHAGSRFIDASFSESEAITSFKQRASLGTFGSSDERGKDAAYTALNSERDKTNVDFYRDEAVLSIVVISDEWDYSRNVSVNEFSSWMSSLKEEDDQTWFSGIIGPSPRGCSSPNGDAMDGKGYTEVIEAVGGIEYSICEQDWSSILEQLGMQAAGLKREFFLSLAPVEDTITVEVRMEKEKREFEPNEYTYSASRNSITFNSFVPDPLTVVEIEYEILASASDPAEDDQGRDGEQE